MLDARNQASESADGDGGGKRDGARQLVLEKAAATEPAAATCAYGAIEPQRPPAAALRRLLFGRHQRPQAKRLRLAVTAQLDGHRRLGGERAAADEGGGYGGGGKRDDGGAGMAA